MRLRLTCIMLAGLAACTLPSGAAAPAVVERRLGLMGTRLELRVEGTDRLAALRASEAAVRALEATEARLSTWKDSELAALNASPPGQPIRLSPLLAAELESALHWSEATEGAFDPVVGALVATWGLRSGGRLPTGAELETALAATGRRHFRLAGSCAVRELETATLEEGAFGKGAGLDAAARALAAAGVLSGFLDLGGQVLALGRSHPVLLADPRHRQAPVVEVDLPAGRSLATSGNSEHGLEVGGRRIGHVLDPRSGRPAPDCGSLSVEASSALAADCLSTGLYVMGPEAALRWAADHPGVEVLVLETRPEGLSARATPGIARRCRALHPGLRIQTLPEPRTTQEGNRP